MKSHCNESGCAVERGESAVDPSAEGGSHRVRPRFRVTRGDREVTVRVVVPGVAKDGVRVTLDQRLLTIDAARAAETPAQWQPVLRELDHSDYRLQLRLSEAIDGERITAGVADGVLTLTLGLATAAKPRGIPVG